MKKLTGIVLLVALFAGCSSPAPQPAPTQPDVIKARMIELAILEWRGLGQQVVRFEGDRERIDPVGIWEDTGRGRLTVAKYWRAVGKDWDGMDCDKPWSAAFLSWIMAEAGVPRAQFPGSALHADYLRAIADGNATSNEGFRLRDPAAYAPKPGDLICAPRDRGSAGDFDDIKAEAPMHCDIVISNSGGVLHSVGGNVRNSVSRTIRTVDSTGLLTSAKDRPWRLVVQNLYP